MFRFAKGKLACETSLGPKDKRKPDDGPQVLFLGLLWLSNEEGAYDKIASVNMPKESGIR